LIGSSLRQANHLLIDPNQVYRLIVLAKGLRSQSRYYWAGTEVASCAVSILEGRDLAAFVARFASAMRQLEYKSGVFPQFFSGNETLLPGGQAGEGSRVFVATFLT